MNDLETVKKLIGTTVGVDANQIELDSDLTKLGLNRLDFAELLNELEDIFDIIIDDNEADMRTVNDIFDHIIA